jgi:VanZ family protein
MKFLKPWLPVICWMAVIFLASTDTMSAEHTSRVIEPFLRWLIPGISQSAVNTIHFYIRKAAHVTEYAIFAILLCRAVVLSRKDLGIWKSVPIALGIAAVYAASDEFHQSFVPSRTASVRDVCIDTCGAMLGIALFWIFYSAWSAMSMRAASLREPAGPGSSA